MAVLQLLCSIVHEWIKGVFTVQYQEPIESKGQGLNGLLLVCTYKESILAFILVLVLFIVLLNQQILHLTPVSTEFIGSPMHC